MIISEDFNFFYVKSMKFKRLSVIFFPPPQLHNGGEFCLHIIFFQKCSSVWFLPLPPEEEGEVQPYYRLRAKLILRVFTLKPKVSPLQMNLGHLVKFCT